MRVYVFSLPRHKMINIAFHFSDRDCNCKYQKGR